MAKYRISGVWKDNKNDVTAYAIHQIFEGITGRAEKKSKEQVISLLETPGATATTWIWNYSTAKWNVGENITLAQDSNGKFLRSNKDNKLTNDLGHLINLQWVL